MVYNRKDGGGGGRGYLILNNTDSFGTKVDRFFHSGRFRLILSFGNNFFKKTKLLRSKKCYTGPGFPN
uniref:Uncharacterized protein n=1 Tax=Lepeophtheirus salmonis TaxID=72036 RepID=A0A0K2VAY7_LEPSM